MVRFGTGAQVTERPPRVFISYCRKREDRDDADWVARVMEISRSLQADGFAVWDDEAVPCVTDDFGAWIGRGLRCVDAVVAVCTPEYRARWGDDQSSGVGFEASILRVYKSRGGHAPVQSVVVRGRGSRRDIPEEIEGNFVELAAEAVRTRRHADPGYVKLLRQLGQFRLLGGVADPKPHDRLRLPEDGRHERVQAVLAAAETIEAGSWLGREKVGALVEVFQRRLPAEHADAAKALAAPDVDRPLVLRGLLLMLSEASAPDPVGSLCNELAPRPAGQAALGVPDVVYARVERRDSDKVVWTQARYRGAPYFGPRRTAAGVGADAVAAALAAEAGAFAALAKPEELAVALVVDADTEVPVELVTGRPARGQPSIARRFRSVTLWPVHDSAPMQAVPTSEVHPHDHPTNAVVKAGPGSDDAWYDAREGKVAVLVGPDVCRRDAVDTHVNLLTVLLPELGHARRVLPPGPPRAAADVLRGCRPAGSGDPTLLAVWTDAELHPFDNLARSL